MPPVGGRLRRAKLKKPLLWERASPAIAMKLGVWILAVRIYGISLAAYNAIRYSPCMIRSFSDRETQHIWEGRRSKKLPSDIQQVARRKLRMLNNAQNLDDLKAPPGNRLEILRGDRKGQHSIRINRQWRICFTWDDGNALNVEIVDYH